MKNEIKYYPEYWAGKRLSFPEVPPEHPKFSRSIVVGNFVFISGCQGQDDEVGKITTDVFEEQMIIALDKIRRAMEEVGSSMNNIIKTLIILKNRKDYQTMRRTELEYYQKYAPFLVTNPPVSTVITGDILGKPEFLIEIEATGVITNTSPVKNTKRKQ